MVSIIKNKTTEDNQKLWQRFTHEEELTPEQLRLFQEYANILLSWNEKTNLTRITALEDMISYHFQDALKLSNFINMQNIKSLVDVGTGGGIPGIPLKIKYPHLSIILLEVNNKKVSFLQEAIQQLGLEDIVVCDLDWRTFLKTTQEQVDLFVARASLSVEELVRAFRGNSPYKHSMIIYWASLAWWPIDTEKKYMVRYETYDVGDKKRRYIFLKREQ